MENDRVADIAGHASGKQVASVLNLTCSGRSWYRHV